MGGRTKSTCSGIRWPSNCGSWLWGVAIWAYPHRGGGPEQKLHGQAAVTSPSDPTLSKSRNRMRTRTRLFMVAVFFVVAALPFGFGFALVQRVFNLRTPDLLKTVTNYVSGVKLFNQRSRYGPGFKIRPPNEDFLDTLDEPPRVSVRRRMIRTIAKVALANYDRWYIIAHSQGTVAAFNGLMETPYAWPGYFDLEDWRKLCAARLCGDGVVPPLPEPTMPHRPVWAGPNEVAYRARIFCRFRGILTLGSPLEKFAAIWPARVPISRLPAFRENTVWINVLDPLDPVSGVLRAYRGHPTALCPPPQDVGYAASSILLLAHLRYLTRTARGYLSDGVAHWLLTGDTTGITAAAGSFAPYDARYRRRGALALLWWFGGFTILALAASWTVRGIWMWWMAPRCDCTLPPPGTIARLVALCEWLFQPASLYCASVVFAVSVIVTAVVGIISPHVFRANEDPPPPDTEGGPMDDVDPDPPRLEPWPTA